MSNTDDNKQIEHLETLSIRGFCDDKKTLHINQSIDATASDNPSPLSYHSSQTSRANVGHESYERATDYATAVMSSTLVPAVALVIGGAPLAGTAIAYLAMAAVGGMVGGVVGGVHAASPHDYSRRSSFFSNSHVNTESKNQDVNDPMLLSRPSISRL